MLYEYALEPSLLNNWKDFRYFTEKFGASQGRLISRYPKRWKKLVYDSLSNCGEVERKRIEEGLQRIDDRLIPRQGTWDPQQDQLTNAEAEHLCRPFHAILARTNPNQREFILDGDSVAETHPLWNVPASQVIWRRAQDMAACVASLLRLAKEILLIDPHFGPENGRHRRPLEAFLVVALEQRHGEPPTRVEIHTSEKSSVTFFMSESQRQLPDIVPEGMRIRLVRWRQKDGGEKLHNRYILTDIGGVKFEVGLDDSDGADGQTEGVALLGSEEYQLRLAQYGGPEPAFDFVDELIIEGKHLLRGKFGGTRSNSLG